MEPPLSIRGTQMFLNHIFKFEAHENERLKLLGVVPVKTTKRGFSRPVRDKISRTTEKFVRDNRDLSPRIYNPIIFDSCLPRNPEVGDIEFWKSRRNLPLSRIYSNNPKVKRWVDNLTDELLGRERNFRHF